MKGKKITTSNIIQSALIFLAILAVYLFFQHLHKLEQEPIEDFENRKDVLLKNCPSDADLSVGVIGGKRDPQILVSCNIKNWEKQTETAKGIIDSLNVKSD